MARIVCLGIVVLDRIWEVPEIPARPIKVTARDYRETGGGMAGTAAVAIAALGGAPELWARVGDDEVGTRLRYDLVRRGVDVGGLRTIPGAASAASAAFVDPQGERLLGVFVGRGLDCDPGWLPLDGLAGVGAVMADIRWGEGALALFEAAGRLGIPRVLDADVDEPKALARLVRAADHVVFSAAGLEQFTGSAAPDEGLRRAARETAGIVGVTLGADGYLWLAAGNLSRAPGFKVAARDTTGAGDVFHGAYTLAIAEGRAPGLAAAFANAAAALKCAAGNGWDGMPARAQVEALLATAPI